VTRCPSDLELELVLRRPGLRSGHLAACPRCAARLAEMERLDDEFHRDVFPATVDAVVARAPRPRRPRPLLWLAPLAAAAAVALVLVRTGGPPAGYLGSKGPVLALAAFAQAPGGAHPLADGDVVPAGAGLRFEVRLARPCRIWVVSIDAEGQVSRIFPPAGEEGAALGAGGPVVLPGGAVLDGRPGPERFFAVCGGSAPLQLAEIERAARQVGAGEGRVRAAGALTGLPAGTLQATFLVEKRP
jgi:anti-sigma factor RsiW